MLYGLCALTPWEARRLSLGEAIALASARKEWHPVLMVAKAFKGRKEGQSGESSMDELMSRHYLREERERKRAEA